MTNQRTDDDEEELAKERRRKARQERLRDSALNQDTMEFNSQSSRYTDRVQTDSLSPVWIFQLTASTGQHTAYHRELHVEGVWDGGRGVRAGHHSPTNIPLETVFLPLANRLIG